MFAETKQYVPRRTVPVHTTRFPLHGKKERNKIYFINCHGFL